MGRKCPQTGGESARIGPECSPRMSQGFLRHPLKPARTLMGNKTGAKSTAELATRPAYVRPFERLAPPPDLTTEGERQLFLDIVLANEPAQFRASDAPLLSAYVRAVEMERTASAHLEREGHIVDGKPSPWLAVLAQSLKAMSTLSHRLRLSPQGRSPTNPKRPQAVSYYDRARLEGQSDDPY
jgi:phage terminase small subunit